MNNKTLGIVLIVIGVILLGYGFSAADSLSSGFTKLFSGKPTEEAIWLQLGGAAALVVGLLSFFRGK